VALGIGGVALMIGLDAASGLGGHLAAEIAVLGAALSYAFAGVFGRRFKGRPPLIVAAGQLTGSSALILPFALIIDRPWTLPAPDLATVGAVIGLALLCTALAYVIFFRILARAGATNLLLVTFLIPVSALLLGIAFLGEHIDAHHLAGMALIGLGLAAIDGRPLRRIGAVR
jgi:drug/metabolite transporter (DMT)-like permease